MTELAAGQRPGEHGLLVLDWHSGDRSVLVDEFGGEIPVGPFALIGDDSIGRGIVETLAGHRPTAVLMRHRWCSTGTLQWNTSDLTRPG